MDDDFKFPGPTHRTSIVGRTGSGKTHAASWILSHANYDQQPWVIFDFKRETLFTELPYIREIGITDDPPEKAGLYITRPYPGQEEQVELFLWKAHARGQIGFYIDEAYMIDKWSKAYRACLTQGRALHIPMINLTQRPVDVQRYVFSEADHHIIFHLNDIRDRKTVEQYVPLDFEERLPEYNARWYDVNRDMTWRTLPAPSKEDILNRFNDRLRPEKPKRIFI